MESARFLSIDLEKGLYLGGVTVIVGCTFLFAG